MKRLLAVVAAVAALVVACGPADAEAPVSVTTQAGKPAGVNVTKYVDGDTIKVSTGETVRFIGIDTPERGQCGFTDATKHLRDVIGGKPVVLTSGARDDVDRYGRILRYVAVDGRDVGLAMIQAGYAIARYDSRDGYGTHPKEAEYVKADAVSEPLCPAEQR